MQYMEAKKQVIFTTEEILSSENIAIYIQEAKRGVNILGGHKIQKEERCQNFKERINKGNTSQKADGKGYFEVESMQGWYEE